MRQATPAIVLAACGAALCTTLTAQVAVPPPPPPPPPPVRIDIATGGQRGGQPPLPAKPLVPNSVIVGRVIDPTTERGVGGVIVTLNGGPSRSGPVTGPQQLVLAPQVLTDSEGRFAFRSLTRGTYSLTATKSGYSAGAYGRARPGGPTRSLQLDDGEAGEVTIRIFKLASVAGQVLDEAGEPIVAAQVRFYRRALVSGRRVLAMSTSAVTDDRGMYRIGNLQPAQYIAMVPMVSVTVPNGGVPTAATRTNLSATASQLSFPAGSSTSGGRQLTADSAFLQQYSSASLAAAAVDDGAGRWRSYSSQYFPNAPGLAGAEILDLKVGDERTGVDFTMRYQPAVNISGQLIAPDGVAGEYVLRLIPSTTAEWTGEPEAALATTDAAGRFVFLGVPAGNYVIQTVRVPQQQIQQNVQTATAGRSGGQAAALNYAALPLLPLHKEPLLWASAPVNAGAEDVHGVMLTLRPGFTISGRMEFVSGAGRPKPEPQRIAQTPIVIEAVDARPGMANGPPSRTLPDGRFITASQQPGRYFIRLGSSPAGWMVQSILINGVDALDTAVELSSDVTNAVITFTDQVTDVRGSVTGVLPGEERPAVLVFPADATGWRNFGMNPARMRRGSAAESNHAFGMGSLPPGDYFIIAVPEAETADWQDPQVLEQLSRHATRLTLAPGERRVMQLPLVDLRISRFAMSFAPGVSRVAAGTTSLRREDERVSIADDDSPDGSEPPRFVEAPAPQQTRDTRASAAAGLGSVSGTVLVEDGGGTRPARLARVSLRGSALQGERIVVTGDDGRFSAQWLPPGSYTIYVTKSAYLAMYYGSTRPGRGPGTTVVVEGGKPVTDINVTLPRGAVVGGRVVDPEGQPIINARVQLLQATMAEGRRVFNTVSASGQSSTDDRGAFRLYGIRPGNYSVMVTPPTMSGGNEVRQLSDQELRAAFAEAAAASSQPSTATAPRQLAPAPPGPLPQIEPTGRTVNHSPIFLPGTTSELDASMVSLAAGQEMTGLSIVVPLVPAARVEGTIVGVDGQPVNGSQVQIQRVMSYPGTFSSAVRMLDGGRFAILGVPPGEYVLTARRSAPPPQPGQPSEQYWAQETIFVSGVDRKDVRLGLRPPFKVTGRVVLEGGTLPPKTDVQVRLEQFVRPGAIQSTRVARLDAGGTFTLPNVTPGRYRLNASVPSAVTPPAAPGLPSTPIWGVKSATLDGNDAYETIVDVGADRSELNAVVTLTTRLAELTGQIQNAKGELVTDMAMVLFSADPRHWTGSTSRRMRSLSRPFADGQYRFAQILPGEYYLAVLLEADPAELNDPAFLEQLIPASLKVTLAEGDRKVQALRVAR